MVIALHGCAGLYQSGGADAAGAAGALPRNTCNGSPRAATRVLLPDSFGPRGKPQGICTEALAGRDIDDETRRGDVLAALRWLARQPGIDTARIVLLGWSNGAQAVLRHHRRQPRLAGGRAGESEPRRGLLSWLRARRATAIDISPAHAACC
ncbi:dienelactone hydrolase family protein [Cupriavidus basilensis]